MGFNSDFKGLKMKLPQRQVICARQRSIWIYTIPANDSNQFRRFKKSSFQQAARLFPTRLIFDKSVLPINMSWRWPQYFSVECNQMQLPEKWQTFTIWSNPWEENCALLGYYAASSGNFLPTFRDNLSVPSSRVKNQKNKYGKERALLIYFAAEPWNHA